MIAFSSYFKEAEYPNLTQNIVYSINLPFSCQMRHAGQGGQAFFHKTYFFVFGSTLSKYLYLKRIFSRL
jgi:hypothetical protein